MSILKTLVLLAAFSGIAAVSSCQKKLTPLDASETVTEPKVLVFWNKLESSMGITSSEIGPGGTFSSGSFTSGVFGSAYIATAGIHGGVSFPASLFPTNGKGTIEFWAKLTNVSTAVSNGFSPEFFEMDDGTSRYSLGIHSNTLEPGQMVGSAGNRYKTSGLVSGNYSNLFGGGWNHTNWHHYALTWDRQGLSGVPSQKVALYLDGSLYSTSWSTSASNDFSAPSGNLLLVASNTASSMAVIMDNLKIYNYAKTDFSDRFTE